MNLEQLKARLAEIVAKVDEFKALASMTEEDVVAINELQNEFDSIKNQIESIEKINAMSAAAIKSEPKVAPKPVAKVEVTHRVDPKGGFQSAGEFFKAVKSAASNPTNTDKRLLASGMYERKAEDGGFLIPTDFRTSIMKKVTGDESLLSRTTQLTTTSNHVSFPVNEVAPWDGTGIQAYWDSEAGSIGTSKDKFRTFDSKLHKITALVRASEELLTDAAILESWIKAQAPLAILHKVNSAIISGDGVAKPKGFLNSNFKYKVTKEVGQDADTVVYNNIVNMYSRMIPSSISKAVWLATPEVMPQLRKMSFIEGAASPVPAYMPPSGLDVAPYGTLLGRPIVLLNSGVKALGDEGDLSFVDLSHYISIVKGSGIKEDMSSHVYFNTQEMAFRFVMRVAGDCPYNAPITTENGNFSMSGIVTLESR